MYKKITLILLILIQVALQAQYYVIDSTNTLTEHQKKNLENIISNCTKNDSSKIILLIIKSTNGTDIVNYTQSLSKKFNINKGIVILNSIQDRKLRIEFINIKYQINEQDYNIYQQFLKENKFYDAYVKIINDICKNNYTECISSDSTKHQEQIEDRKGNFFVISVFIFTIILIALIIFYKVRKVVATLKK